MVQEHIEHDICAICRDDLFENVKTLDCTHAFHVECINSWLRVVNSCPFCRAAVLQPIPRDLRISNSEDWSIPIPRSHEFDLDVSYTHRMTSTIYDARSGNITIDDIYDDLEADRVPYDELVLLIQEGYITDIPYLLGEELIDTETYGLLFEAGLFHVQSGR